MAYTIKLRFLLPYSPYFEVQCNNDLMIKPRAKLMTNSEKKTLSSKKSFLLKTRF